MSDTPRIWIGCLASYNAGHLHGEWIDADQDEDALWEEVNAILKSSPVPLAEEWYIADSEGFHPWRHGEYASMKDMSIVGRLIAEKGEAVAHWLANDDSVLEDNDYEGVLSLFEDQWRGEWSSDQAYAESYVRDCGLPGNFGLGQEALDALEPYLDWDALTEWATSDMTVIEAGSKVYVFDPNC